jgi:hypothetical protein
MLSKSFSRLLEIAHRYIKMMQHLMSVMQSLATIEGIHKFESDPSRKSLQLSAGGQIVVLGCFCIVCKLFTFSNVEK